MTPEELYEKLKDRIIFSCLAKIVDEKTLNDKGNIKLIQQAKSEWTLEEIVKAKSLTEHLSQEERNEYFDLIIRNLMNDKT